MVIRTFISVGALPRNPAKIHQNRTRNDRSGEVCRGRPVEQLCTVVKRETRRAMPRSLVWRPSPWRAALPDLMGVPALSSFLEKLGHKARRRMCPLYVAGLIGPGDRKSVQPMAERLAPGDYDQLHHFVAAGVWDASPLETELLVQADRLVGGSDAVLVIDDTAMPKKGMHSVGVAAQYASALGKTANCQTLVSLTLACGEVPVMVALRLFLPDSWISDRRRLERAGVPVEYRTARTKPEIALAEIDRMISADVRFRCVLADAGYGLSAPFRQGLTARKLAWAVGVPRHLKVYPIGVQLIWPVTKVRGRPRKRHVPDILSIPAEDMLASAKWKTVSWRSGTKGRLKARFAAVRVRTADGPPQRIWDKASSICQATKRGSSTPNGHTALSVLQSLNSFPSGTPKGT